MHVSPRRITMAAQAGKGHKEALCSWLQTVNKKGKILNIVIKYGWKEGTGIIFPNGWWQAWKHLSDVFVLKDKFHARFCRDASVCLEFIPEPQDMGPGSVCMYGWVVKMKVMGVFSFIPTSLAVLFPLHSFPSHSISAAFSLCLIFTTAACGYLMNTPTITGGFLYTARKSSRQTCNLRREGLLFPIVPLGARCQCQVHFVSRWSNIVRQTLTCF